MNRRELRQALTAGLGNAFAILSGLPFGYYVPLAVLSVGADSYGGSLRLGRQRVMGTLLGSLLLVVASRGLEGVPMPLGLAVTLGSLRLLGGWLGLQVGYKVGGLVVVMGWLVHGGQLDAWVPMRLFWTVFGVVISLVSLRLFWPATGLDQALADYRLLLTDLRRTCRTLADRSAAVTTADQRALRRRLLAMRRRLPTLAEELGTAPRRHPAYRLMMGLDEAASRLISCIGGLGRQAAAVEEVQLLERLHGAETDLLLSLEERLQTWERCLESRRPGGGLPAAPSEPFAMPVTWSDLGRELSDPQQSQVSLETLERIAGRLVLCRQARQAMVEAERQWQGLGI
ncbi:MAG: FUSC family protein [Prochlorococcaceae cyanobacterium]|jgi:hypothetical protein